MRKSFPALALSLLASLAARPAAADEGMWTFDNFPRAKVEAAYGVTIDKPWLERVQAAAIRLSNGCSGAVVSAKGLVLTNQHCIVECVQNLSTDRTDHVRDGFLIQTREEERRCPAMQAEMLESITDLTPKIREATAGKSGEAFTNARERAFREAEEEACANGHQKRCEVISLHRGGEFKLYTHRVYPDVRLVFAPEFASAFFGGDPDNFNFPRYNLDAAFLRIYQEDAPLDTPISLHWLTRAPKAGEPTFVAGNPGSTERQLTVAQLETQRDLLIPLGQLQRAELRGRLLQFAQASAEHRRIATDPIFGLENAFKVYVGRQAALSDRTFMDARRAAEAQLRAKLAADPGLAAEVGDPWGEIARVQAAVAANYVRYRQLENGAGSSSSLFGYARRLVRAAQEGTKPSAGRLPEYADVRLPAVEREVLDAAPVYPELEALYLDFWLSKTRESLGADDEAVRLLLGDESPEGLAARLVRESKLADPAVRAALWKGGLPAVRASRDPMIRLAWKLDEPARDARRAWEKDVARPTDRAAQRIARARFSVYGDSIYPDATFTLRLSYGQVAGWTERGEAVAPFTDFAGLYRRATGAEPYALAPRWVAARTQLNRKTVLNFTTTNDIIGGNSGSPVITGTGELIGVAFDGNIHSLRGNYGYDPDLNRTVAVSTAAITEALETVYGQTRLAAELTAP